MKRQRTNLELEHLWQLEFEIHFLTNNQAVKTLCTWLEPWRRLETKKLTCSSSEVASGTVQLMT